MDKLVPQYIINKIINKNMYCIIFFQLLHYQLLYSLHTFRGALVVDEVGSTGEKLLSFIHDNPGYHLRRIKRGMGISMGTVQYHLDRLENNGKITSTKRGFYKYYFPIGIFKENERNTSDTNSRNNKKNTYANIEYKCPTQTDIVNRM